MGRNPLSGGRARRYVRTAQIAGVAVGVSAAALWALEVPGLKPMGQLTVAPPKPAGEVQPVQSHRPTQIDAPTVIAIADGLERARGAREAKKVEPNTEPTEPAQSDGWRYLGAVTEPGRLLALVSVGGKQRIVSEGRVIDKTEVVSITDDAITLDDGHGEKTIKRQKRQGPSVAWVSMPDAPVGSGNNVSAGTLLEASGLVNGDGQPLNPDQLKRLEERGIDSDVIAKAKAARDAMAARRAARAKAHGADAATPAAVLGVPGGSATDSAGGDKPDQRDRD